MTSCDRSRWRPFLRRAGLVLILLVFAFSALPFGQNCWKALFRLSGFGGRIEAPLSIHVIDVGKADAVLLECEGHAALLDAGTDLSGETVVDYLVRRDVKYLDYVIASHPDKDHAGGIPTVLSEMDCGEFLRSRYYGDKYTAIDSVLQEKSLPQSQLEPGDTLTLGGAVLRVLGPLAKYKETNDTSLVLRLEYEGFTALLCGDIEKDAEKDLIKSGADLSADLLKVPHHGSDSSCSKRFLLEVAPQYAVISVGNDSHNLPDEEIVQRLDSICEKVLRTDIDGTVIFTYENGTVQVQTEK